MSPSQDEESAKTSRTVDTVHPANVDRINERSKSFAGQDAQVLQSGVNDDTSFDGARQPDIPWSVGASKLDRLSLDVCGPQSENVEGGMEVKDAVHLLSRRKIEKLRSVRDALKLERDNLQMKVAHAAKERDAAVLRSQDFERQIGKQTASINALTREVNHLRHQFQQWKDDQLRWRNLPNRERTLLLEQIEAQRHQIEIWKGSAITTNSVAVSLAWQSSVDGAIRKEREKDSWVIDDLRREVEDLKSKAVG